MRLLIILLISMLLLMPSLARATPICGNGVCEDSETHYTCAADCVSGAADGYCDAAADGKCDPDCIGTGLDPDCHESARQAVTPLKDKTQMFNLAVAIAFLAAILCFVLIIIRRTIKAQTGGEYQRQFGGNEHG